MLYFGKQDMEMEISKIVEKENSKWWQCIKCGESELISRDADGKDCDRCGDISEFEADMLKNTEQLFDIFNETDGVHAHCEPVTYAEAKRICADFPKRFEHQGFYRTANCQRVSPWSVQLVLQPLPLD